MGRVAHPTAWLSRRVGLNYVAGWLAWASFNYWKLRAPVLPALYIYIHIYMRSFYCPAPTPLIRNDSSTPNQPSLEEPMIESETFGVEKGQTSLETEGSNANESVGLRDINTNNVDQVIADLGLRMPIEQIDANIRDAARRAYIAKGPCQPKGHRYPKRVIGNRNRFFHDEWYVNNPWLEYSFAKGVAFCFCCYLFKQPRAEMYGVDV
jgi:hypothetical protein